MAHKLRVKLFGALASAAVAVSLVSGEANALARPQTVNVPASALAADQGEPFVPGIGESLDTDSGRARQPDADQLAAINDLRKSSQAKAATSRSAQAPTTLLNSFATGPDRPVPVSRANHPYTRQHVVALDGNQPRDSTGVPVYLVNGRAYQHPVRQAFDGIDMLESYKLTGNTAYLDRAKADAQRLIDTRVVSREAWFFPYEFDFALHGNSQDVIKAPWYSAMAQGIALSLFTQLYQWTKDPKYREAADRTFASLTLGPSGSLPFVTWVDASGHLFLEEYAQQPLERSDRTLNGHLFALYGIHDYYQLTESPVASQIFSGALKMVRDYYPSYRNANWISSYCLTHPYITDTKYHAIHVDQFRRVAALTGRTDWSTMSDQLFDDYPDPDLRTTVYLAAGRHTGYQFNSTGGVTATKVERYNTATRASIDKRVRIKGRGIFYRVTSGPWAGWYLPERPTMSYAHVQMRVRTHPIARQVTLPSRELIVRQFNNAGETTSLKRITPSAPTPVQYTQITVINGETWVRPYNGPAPYHWVRAADVGIPGHTSYVAPKIVSVNVSPATGTRSSTSGSLVYAATVVIDDPSDVVRSLDVVAGYTVQGPATARIAAQSTIAIASGGPRKTYAVRLESPYALPSGTTPYGKLQVLAVGSNPAIPSVAAAGTGWMEIKGATVVTANSSAARVSAGVPFTLSGKLSLFNGQALSGRSIKIYHVPAGSTTSSYAGMATTNSSGQFSLPVRAWYTGGWFAQYAGSASDAATYRSTWVTVG